MSSVVESETGRGACRPLSTGLWTLLSWLRRDSSSSSDSISSAGSDRTALSFAFLHPRNYQTPSSPLLVRPLDSPTNSYKKRIRDSNFRRRFDRDITLHRKYGLYRGDNSYDAFSLPPARRTLGATLEKQERDRRATSEYLHRRIAHVPGKRRAPLPPGRANSAEPIASASITRRHSRKRPAPQPPIKLTEKIKENIGPPNVVNDLKQMNSTTVSNNLETEGDIVKRRLQEKNGRSSKSTHEKGFFKQIFDNKKRYSAAESHIKLLPNISELDREAADIIESRKLKIMEQNTNISNNKVNNKASYKIESTSNSNHWFCTKCLRRYGSTVEDCVHCVSEEKELYEKVTALATCIYTQTENNFIDRPSTSRIKEVDERQKLKEMLKEMKHSLPKRQNIEIGNLNNTEKSNTHHKVELETPTLRIGSISENKDSNHTQPTSNTKPSYNKNMVIKDESLEATERVSASQKVVEANSSAKPKAATHNIQQSDSLLNRNVDQIFPAQAALSLQNANIQMRDKSQIKNESNINAPLRISTLLNPVYVPRSEDKIDLNLQKNVSHNKQIEKSSEISKPTTSALTITSSSFTSTLISPNITITKNNTQIENDKRNYSTAQIIAESPKSSTPTSKALIVAARYAKFNLEKLDRHSRRRELINQLEQSIANGDERAAAEAASKLAQLKLSCSVLSFTSQIVGETSSATKKSSIPETLNENKVKLKPKSLLKVNTASQYVKPDTNKLSKMTDKHDEKIEQTVIPTKNIGTSETPKTVDSKLDKSSKKQLETEAKTSDMASIEVWVEDREATRGPIQLHISRLAVLSDLQRQAQASLGLATKLQRWIVGTTLCANEDTLLITLAGSDFSAPFYLCVVESESTNNAYATQPTDAGEAHTESKGTKIAESGDVYSELVQLERYALVPNKELFECAVCMEACPAGKGAVLRECVHTFCRECLADVIRHCEEPAVSCPAIGCPGDLQEREIKALVSPEDYEKWLARGLAAAESGTRNAFHCRTKDCTGWAMCDPGVRRFPCPVCKHTNCVQCQAIHENETCEQHRATLQAAAVASTAKQTDEGTRSLLENLIARGEALECPECKAIITKKWGCDWIKCAACKTEICWVTRGRRWGSAGRGDTSSGCRCGVDGKRCHPSCGYCH